MPFSISCSPTILVCPILPLDFTCFQPSTLIVKAYSAVRRLFCCAFCHMPCRLAAFEDTQPKKAEDSADVSILRGKRILLAEDNDLNAEIAIAMLSEVGLVIDRAENGVDCAEKLDKAPAGYYSLILMDIQMPVQDGYATTEMIRRFSDPKKANIPIIAMTANAFAEDREKALAVGMNDHVAKPIDMNKLIPVIHRYL